MHLAPAIRPASCRPFFIGLLAILAALASLAIAPAASRAAACTPPVVNKVACENTLPGADPSTWEVDGNGDADIQGFATAMSVNVGDTVGFKIKSTSSNYPHRHPAPRLLRR